MLGVVGYLQDGIVIEVPFKVEGCLKHYFYIDPIVTFNFASFKYIDKDGTVKDSEKATFSMFMSLYVNRILSIYIKDTFQLKSISDFMNTEIPKIKKNCIHLASLLELYEMERN